MLKRCLIFQIFLFVIFYLPIQKIRAQSSTMGTGSSKIGTMQPLEKPTPRSQPKSSPLPEMPPSPQLKPIAQQIEYFYPGILVNKNGVWQGGDDLLNLSGDIGFYLSIIKPEQDSLIVNEAKLKQASETFLKNAGITAKTLTLPGQAPLPYFQIQILLYPIGKEGYVACCEGRLFESVSLKRITMDAKNMAFQAVTWQKSSLMISPSRQINEQIQQHVEDIVKAFAERFQSFNIMTKELIK